jgi:hypothetical protein
MVHGCTLFLPLQTRTHDLWTNNEQPKRRNEMSDKMITPDEYLIENPTHMLVENELDGHTYAEYVKDKKRVCSDALQINWTGYTEPHVMIGPDFPQSRKRVVEWGNPFVMHTDFRPIEGFECRQLADCEGAPTNIWQWGKYIDEPVKSKPELSRFLPDGWAWKFEDSMWAASDMSFGLYCYRSNGSTNADIWHEEGLLHPSEGGGFQKHNTGDPMPCDKIMIDLIWDDELIHYEVPRGFSKLNSGGAICIGWRPHYKEKN